MSSAEEYHAVGMHPGDRPDRGIKTTFQYALGRTMDDTAGPNHTLKLTLMDDTAVPMCNPNCTTLGLDGCSAYANTVMDDTTGLEPNLTLTLMDDTAGPSPKRSPDCVMHCTTLPRRNARVSCRIPA